MTLLLVGALLLGQNRGAGVDPAVAAYVKRLNDLVADLQRGRVVDVHKALQPLMETATGDEKRAVVKYLKSRGIDVGLESLIVDSRVQAALLGQHKALKAPGPIEAPLALKALADRLDGMLAPIDKELDIGFRVNMAHAAMDETLERLPDLMDQADAAGQLQTALADVAKSIKGNVKKKLDPDLQKILARNFKKDQDAIKERNGKLIDRIAELCIARIPDQMVTMQSDKAVYKDRFKAVSRLEETFALLRTYWPKYRGRKNNKAGEKEGVWKQQEQVFARDSSSLRLKAYHFEQGKEWWLRGRYGHGAINGGLAKATYGAGVPQQQEWLMYGPLLMPDPIPKPADPLKQPKPVPVARRHIEIWKVANAATGAIDFGNQAVMARRRWRLAMAPAGESPEKMTRWIDWEPVCAANVVGYVEYQMALYHWGKLLQLVSRAELQGLEDTLGEDDRFIVHNYLSRKYDNLEPNSTLRLTPEKAADPRAKDQYERRGLRWAVALARLELSAMRSLYTAVERDPKPIYSDRFGNLSSTPLTREQYASGIAPIGSDPVIAVPAPSNIVPARVRPYEKWPPTEFDRSQYAELLWDGAREQYYRLRTLQIIAVPVRPNQAGLGADQPVTAGLTGDRWALFVRYLVALEMVTGYRDLYGSTLAAPQHAEMRAWLQWMELILGRISTELSTAKGDLEQSFVRLPGNIGGNIFLPPPQNNDGKGKNKGGGTNMTPPPNNPPPKSPPKATIPPGNDNNKKKNNNN